MSFFCSTRLMDSGVAGRDESTVRGPLTRPGGNVIEGRSEDGKEESVSREARIESGSVRPCEMTPEAVASRGGGRARFSLFGEGNSTLRGGV